MAARGYVVRNVRGTSRRACACGSWREHWYNHVTRPSGREVCARYGCGNPVEIGAHVAVVNGQTDWQHWIVPFCQPCNMIDPDEDLDLKDGVELISANAKLMGCYLR